MSDQMATMRTIAERIAEVRGTHAEIIERDDGFTVQRRWQSPNSLASPVAIFVDDDGEIFVEQNRRAPFRHPLNESMRAWMKKIDNAMEGLITYGIKQGGDQELIAWWFR